MAIECGKCSSIQAAILKSSSSLSPLNEYTYFTVGAALVSVPVLSNTIVSAAATASKNLPPFTVISFCPACLIADNTVIGIASLSAQEKSTISIDNAFVAFLVRRYVSAVPPNVYGTNESARCSALLSRPDLSFSDSSIILTILSYLLLPPLCLTFIVSPPSSITVPANTALPIFLLTGTASPVSEA